MSKKILKHEVPKPLDAEAISREKIPQEMFQMVSGEKIFDQQIEGEAIGFFKDAWIRFKKNKAAVIGGIIILLIVLMAIFAPMFSKYHFRQQHTSLGTLPPDRKSVV